MKTAFVSAPRWLALSVCLTVLVLLATGCPGGGGPPDGSPDGSGGTGGDGGAGSGLPDGSQGGSGQPGTPDASTDGSGTEVAFDPDANNPVQPPPDPSTPPEALPPPAPLNVLLFSNPAGPPNFDVRWEVPDTNVAIGAFTVYESTDAISAANPALASATATGAARAATIQLDSNSGIRHYRVSATSTFGIEGPLYREFVLDTTGRVVFRSDKTIDNVMEVYSVRPRSLIEPSNLSGLVDGRMVDETAVSPDGRYLAFTADKEHESLFELYVSPIDAVTPPVNLSGALVQGGEVITEANTVPFIWSPEGRRIAFLADRDTNNLTELYVAFTDGSSDPIKVSGLMTPGGTIDVDSPRAFDWSPEGKRLAFIADKQTDGVNELFVANGKAPPIPVSGPIVAGGNVTQFQWAPDGQRIAILGDLRTDGVQELFVAAADGQSTPLVVSGPPMPTAEITSFGWSSDGNRLALITDRRLDDAMELFIADPTATADPSPVNPFVNPTADVVAFQWSPDAHFIAYASDQNTDGLVEIFVSPANAGLPPTDVTGTRIPESQVGRFAWSPDSNHLAFTSDKYFPRRIELFVTTRDGAEEPNSIGEALLANGDVVAFAWSPTGDRLALVADKDSNHFELFVASILGTRTPIIVSGTMCDNCDVSDFGLTWTPLANR